MTSPEGRLLSQQLNTEPPAQTKWFSDEMLIDWSKGKIQEPLFSEIKDQLAQDPALLSRMVDLRAAPVASHPPQNADTISDRLWGFFSRFSRPSYLAGACAGLLVISVSLPLVMQTAPVGSVQSPYLNKSVEQAPGVQLDVEQWTQAMKQACASSLEGATLEGAEVMKEYLTQQETAAHPELVPFKTSVTAEQACGYLQDL